MCPILPHVTHCDARGALIQHREVGDEQFERLDKAIPPRPDRLIDHLVKERRADVHVREAARVQKEDEEMDDQGYRDPRHFGRGVPFHSAERCPRPCLLIGSVRKSCANPGWLALNCAIVVQSAAIESSEE